MYDAKQIANYIINRTLIHQKPITNVHLQKILYFLQANHLVNHNKPLFHNKISKWHLGPTIIDVYDTYKYFGSKPIRSVQIDYIFDQDLMDIREIHYTESEIDFETQKIIKPLIESLLEKDSDNLIQITQNQKIWYDYENHITNNSNQ